MRERFFDEKDREAIGWVKRCQEYKAMIPGFADRLKESPAEVLKEYGLPLKPEDVFFKKHPDNMDPKQHKRMEAEYPGSKAELYAGFMNKKLDALQTLRDDNTPSNSKFAKWRENQILRCILDLGPQAPFLVHVPISFEIADGCSVGCEFCGLNAGPLKELFRYTDENAALWKDVLARSKEVVGPAAGGGTLYCATEPLDNPDYELLMHDFKDCFGVIPQITTATAARHIDRLHELLKELNEDGRTVYRFSILSEEIFHKIMDAFTPEELVLVELIPQFDEARNHHFVHTGRYARDHKSMPAYQMEQEGLGQEEDAPEKAYSGTIACMSGFLINMCRRSITLSTPTWQDEDHPTGQYILAEEHFTDGADYQAKLERMIEKHMKTNLEPDDILFTYPYLSCKPDGNAVCFESGRGSILKTKSGSKSDTVNAELIKKVFELASEGCYTRREIVKKALQATGYSAVGSEYLYYLINSFWKRGVFAVRGELL